jgi:hypothetical protein
MIEMGEVRRSAPRMLLWVAWVMMLVIGGLGACQGTNLGASQETSSRDRLIVPTDDSTRVTQGTERSTPISTDLPPIDAAAPTATQSATFALG